MSGLQGAPRALLLRQIFQASIHTKSPSLTGGSARRTASVLVGEGTMASTNSHPSSQSYYHDLAPLSIPNNKAIGGVVACSFSTAATPAASQVDAESNTDLNSSTIHASTTDTNHNKSNNLPPVLDLIQDIGMNGAYPEFP